MFWNILAINISRASCLYICISLYLLTEDVFRTWAMNILCLNWTLPDPLKANVAAHGPYPVSLFASLLIEQSMFWKHLYYDECLESKWEHPVSFIWCFVGIVIGKRLFLEAENICCQNLPAIHSSQKGGQWDTPWWQKVNLSTQCNYRS